MSVLCHLEDHAVTEEHLDLLRENIGNKWKRCARRLSLTTVEIETIEHDFYRDGLPEMVHQMLERWKMKEGSIGCTIGKLCRALEGNIKVDVIQKILDACGSSSSISWTSLVPSKRLPAFGGFKGFLSTKTSFGFYVIKMANRKLNSWTKL